MNKTLYYNEEIRKLSNIKLSATQEIVLELIVFNKLRKKKFIFFPLKHELYYTGDGFLGSITSYFLNSKLGMKILSRRYFDYFSGLYEGYIRIINYMCFEKYRYYYSFPHRIVAEKDKKKLQTRLIISKDKKVLKNVEEFLQKKGDINFSKKVSRYFGKHLGYPKCCVKQFVKDLKEGKESNQYTCSIDSTKRYNKQCRKLKIKDRIKLTDHGVNIALCVPCSPLCKEAEKLYKQVYETTKKSHKEVNKKFNYLKKW